MITSVRNFFRQMPTGFDLVEMNNLLLKTKKRVDEMDKQIKKVQKDVEKGNAPKAKKDIKTLLKMDKKFDAKLERCEPMPKKKKGK